MCHTNADEHVNAIRDTDTDVHTDEHCDVGRQNPDAESNEYASCDLDANASGTHPYNGGKTRACHQSSSWWSSPTNRSTLRGTMGGEKSTDRVGGYFLH